MSEGESAGTAGWKLFGRNRRRYGGYLIHLGVVVIGIGIIGSTVYQKETQETITPGNKITVGNLTMTYNNIFDARADDGRDMVIANVSVYRSDQKVADIRPRKDFFGGNASPMSIAGQYSTLESDFYVLLTAWEGDRATFKIFLNPLVNLVWWGGIVLMIGTAVAAWPSPEREAVTRIVDSPALQMAGD